MSFYEKHLLPHVIRCACGSKPIMAQRRKVVPQATGTVLEIGIGSGLNLPLYDADKVDKLIGLDPSVESWALAAEVVSTLPFDVEFIGLPGEDIPLEDDSVDTVVVTFSLCTIPDPVSALRGMARVLRPGGRLLFCEHGKAPDRSVQQWQQRLNGPWRAIAGGCNINRDIPLLLEASGFSPDGLEEGYIPDTPRVAGYNYWGSAALA